MIHDLILGTAGHIDHGKTTLIKSLTGVDTDRLPEEKRRGITIELGFAELRVGDYRLGIVDVPGHERFVRQMLAGATGMDVAMLVIAADDSVKPQTREHLDVLRLLDLSAGVIVLTKVDLVDRDWLELVKDEVRELVAGTFLAAAPMIETSATTGEGIDDLRLALETAAQHAWPRAQRRRDVPFRLAVDRAFTVTGFGTVVTGSVVSGQARIGDTLELQPGGLEVRVRGLRNHDREVEDVGPGQRAALNIAGVHHEQVMRGHELVAPGYLAPSRLVTVRLDVLPGIPRPLKRRQRVRMHIGTAEVLATVVPLSSDTLPAGSSGWAQLYLREPIVATWNQPFVLRNETPVATVAGGRILVPEATRIRRLTPGLRAWLDRVESTDLTQRASAAFYLAGSRAAGPSSLPRIAGVQQPVATMQALLDTGELVCLQPSGHRQLWIHARRLEEYADRIVAWLEQVHDAAPLKRSFDRSLVANRFPYLGDTVVLDTILRRLAQARRIELTEKSVGLSHRGPQLSKAEKELYEQLIERFRAAGWQPPTVADCQQAAPKHQKAILALLRLAVAEGFLVEISKELFLHKACETALRQRLDGAFQQQSQMTVSDIKEQLQTSRKYAVPICEYLDRVGYTTRAGDLRQRNPAATSAVT